MMRGKYLIVSRKWVKGHLYFYLNIPKELSDQLKIEKGDEFSVELVSKGRGIYGIEFMKRRKK